MKPQLVLLPGMMCDERLFLPQIACLEKTHHIVVPELSQDSIEAMALSVLAAVEGKFSLAGLSMGGIVAMEILAKARQRVDRLVLLNTNARAEAKQVAKRRMPQIKAAQGGELERIMTEELVPRYALKGAHRQEIERLCRDMALKLGPEVFVRQSLALMNRPDQVRNLSLITCPTMIISGEGDQMCPPSHHALMATEIRHSQWVRLENCGHISTLEQPEQITKLLSDFLNGPLFPALLDHEAKTRNQL